MFELKTKPNLVLCFEKIYLEFRYTISDWIKIKWRIKYLKKNCCSELMRFRILRNKAISNLRSTYSCTRTKSFGRSRRTRSGRNCAFGAKTFNSITAFCTFCVIIRAAIIPRILETQNTSQFIMLKLLLFMYKNLPMHFRKRVGLPLKPKTWFCASISMETAFSLGRNFYKDLVDCKYLNVWNRVTTWTWVGIWYERILKLTSFILVIWTQSLLIPNRWPKSNKFEYTANKSKCNKVAKKLCKFTVLCSISCVYLVTRKIIFEKEALRPFLLIWFRISFWGKILERFPVRV